MKLNVKIERKREIVDTFRSNVFIASKGILGIHSNCHWQTIVGSEALRVKLLGSYPRYFETITERLHTADKDFFDVDFTKNIESSIGIVILSHGLESNTKGPLITKMAAAFLSKGFSCCLVSFRGCNGEENDTPGAYHLGFTDDLKYVIKTLNSRFPSKPLYLSGFSLGGNVLLKCLGELGDEASGYNIMGSVAVCVPFDPVASQCKMDKGFNRAVYIENFLQTLKAKAIRQHSRFPSAFDIDQIKQCRKIGDFDEAYIAKIYQFEDKVDYYKKTGSKWWLSKIRVPTIAINALDDPFIEESTLPGEEDIGAEAPVRLIYHNNGGHCGFMADESRYEYIHQDLRIKNLNQQTSSALCFPSHGFLAEEMARAMLHIHIHNAIREIF